MVETTMVVIGSTSHRREVGSHGYYALRGVSFPADTQRYLILKRCYYGFWPMANIFYTLPGEDRLYIQGRLNEAI